MRVVAAMSGGVDSSVVAGLLAEAGHEVIGVTLQLYDHGAAAGRKGACCAGRDVADARDVADRLGIPHYVIDAEARFRDAVIRDFADSYAAGETPIPCVRCNQSVKFTDLLGLARDLGAEAMATGHYVRRVEGADGPELHRARDGARDQSWFLFATTPDQLGFSRFPLGDMPDKAAVRAEAARLGLPVADKPDSQDICFVPSGSYADLVGRMRPEALEPGDIVERGRRGARAASRAGALYGRSAQGARRGRRRRRGGAGAGPGHAPGHGRAAQRRADADRAAGRELAGGRGGRRSAARSSCARARRRTRPRCVGPAAGAAVELDAPALAAPGQACVMYRGSRMLGGGFICPPSTGAAD